MYQCCRSLRKRVINFIYSVIRDGMLDACYGKGALHPTCSSGLRSASPTSVHASSISAPSLVHVFDDIGLASRTLSQLRQKWWPPYRNLSNLPVRGSNKLRHRLHYDSRQHHIPTVGANACTLPTAVSMLQFLAVQRVEEFD